jgi:molybdopterin biosynthesis enzyme
MMPISLAMAERCDAVLRIGGTSVGAEQEVEVFKRKGLPVYYGLDEIPQKEV